MNTQNVSQIHESVNTPVSLTDFCRTRPAVRFCTCGQAVAAPCHPDNAAPAPAVTIVAAHSASRRRTVYTAVIVDPRTGAVIDDLSMKFQSIVPCDALELAAKASHQRGLPIRLDLIQDEPESRIDWRMLSDQVSARLYQRGADAFEASGGDPDGWVERPQRILGRSGVVTRMFRDRVISVLDNAVTQAGFDDAAVLAEAEAALSSAPGFEWLEDEEVLQATEVSGCTISLIRVPGGYVVEHDLLSATRSDLIAEFDQAAIDYQQWVYEEQAIADGMMAYADEPGYAESLQPFLF